MEKRSKRSHGSVSNISKVHGLLHVTDAYLFSSTLVYGPSMLPTLNISGMLLSEHVSRRIGMVGSDDLVLVWSRTDPRKIVTKRVQGMQGDKVTYFVDPKHSGRSQTTVVPKGHAWIQGDNIYSSFASQTYGGPIPRNLIQGNVFCRFFVETTYLQSKEKQPLWKQTLGDLRSSILLSWHYQVWPREDYNIEENSFLVC